MNVIYFPQVLFLILVIHFSSEVSATDTIPEISPLIETHLENTIEFSSESVSKPVILGEQFPVHGTGACILGDFNCDNDVDGHDYLIWQRGESFLPLSASDYMDWETYFGFSFPLFNSPYTVPEPSSLLLIGLSAGLIGLRWRGKQF